MGLTLAIARRCFLPSEGNFCGTPRTPRALMALPLNFYSLEIYALKIETVHVAANLGAVWMD